MPSIGGWHCSGSDNPRRARVWLGIELISAGIGSDGIDGSVVMVCCWLELRVEVSENVPAVKIKIKILRFS
jgi:hypothetical protein